MRKDDIFLKRCHLYVNEQIGGKGVKTSAPQLPQLNMQHLYELANLYSQPYGKVTGLLYLHGNMISDISFGFHLLS